MFLLSLYLLDTSKTSHASKMLDIIGICVNNFNETVTLKKLYAFLRRLFNEQVIHFFNICMLRAIAGNTFHINIFLTLCIQFVLCMDCQLMK